MSGLGSNNWQWVSRCRLVTEAVAICVVLTTGIGPWYNHTDGSSVVDCVVLVLCFFKIVFGWYFYQKLIARSLSSCGI